MTVLVGFIILLMMIFLAYMAYRLHKRRKKTVLAAFCLQIFTITIASISFFKNVSTNNMLEGIYIIFGILLPCSFLIYDCRKVVVRVRETGVFDSLVESAT